MQASLFNDTLTIIPPGFSDVPDGQGGVVRTVSPAAATAFQTPGRIEAIRPRGGASSTNITEAGDLSEATHICYLPAALVDPDSGEVVQSLRIGVDTHVIDSAGLDYIVRGVSSSAIGRREVDHLELSMRLAPAP